MPFLYVGRGFRRGWMHGMPCPYEIAQDFHAALRQGV